MKKVSILGLIMLSGLSMSAQMSLVKDADKQFKPGKTDYAEWVKVIEPAFTNPESAGNVETWFVAGENGFKNFDTYFNLMQLGQQVDNKATAAPLVAGYGYFMKALPLDSVPNAKGKVNPKKSKKMISMITEHYNDFDNAGRMLYQAGDYKGAYDAWGIYLNMPSDPRFKSHVKVDADSVINYVVFLRGCAAGELGNYDDAFALYDQAIAKGYTKKNIFEQGIYTASRAHKNEKLYDYAAKGYKYCGNEDPKFLLLVIDSHIQKGEFDQAQTMLGDALKSNPNDPQIYYVSGILYENKKEFEKAAENYMKAIKLNEKHVQAMVRYAAMLIEQSDALAENAGNLSESEYHALEAEKINPLRIEAAKWLEKAYALDDSQMDALRYLKGIYYVLKDETNLKRVEELLKY